MHVSAIVTGTPVWVWLLLGYVLLRGLRALSPRETDPGRMLLLPAIFLVWGLDGIFTRYADWSVALAAFVIALLGGGALGWAVARRREPARRDPATGRIWRPGTAVTLVLVLVGFVGKYALGVSLALHPALAAAAGFALLSGALSGVVAGVFWGTTAVQFRQAYSPAPARA